MLNLEKSAAAFEEAKKLMPGGVNSPVRSYRSVDCNPPFIARAEGSHIFDIDGNEYIDYVGSWGPMVVGHAHPQVVKALQEAATRGTSYGAPTLIESQLAKKVMEVYPSMEVIRMVNSGTEATMSALRLARGYTGRNKIVKFIGCYHGHSDSLLVKAGSGMATFGVPDSPGVTPGTAQDTITIPYNDFEAFKAVFAEQGAEIAAVIVEPVAGNMGLVLPKPGYLDLLRKVTTEHGALLIFDEVMCGFRASLGGAQAAYAVKPDLTCLGKIIGGGLPVAAYGGRRDIMEKVSPAGPVYQAGTLSGNPLAMTAGLETLKIITAPPEPGEPDYSRVLTIRTKKLVLGVAQKAKEAGVTLQVQQAGSMFGFFFSDKEVTDYETSAAADQEAFKVWFKAMLEQGIYLAPSQFETLFMSGAHTDEEIDRTIEAAGVALKKVADYLAAR
ncbi:MAG: glutamate-1-semialdehyde 2,1-aminomutase [Selenomonadaceae bacterium]|uniref:glutamate-1-semialdehyde 2,1-aminomutase n=1 Tax=Anaerovibrio slackiae TaxID=2652309 RepID=UPI0023F1ACEA|nr:glutamate-1-semialdehyde 2,1-aminomutase [Anaerovibrio slackiae]MBQ5585832.1 glutamate-1-semialdehyde 2,1-aminomutase [Selenomonadaceae bacterium]MBQ5821686.1 glutamate-1-semialdehyde 2,1-aminomutase [Selenomonadaceae bacterium]MBQ5846422.1 glutamate-1-semialdehyde 2,1-aminomutase [Selenomonadaceae bacterium]MBR0358687.1 glutamate-1-semialdehyde 2,1-aminomutase [Selenomonadaceae bacterium]MDD6163762.1 glutamate-1-semialdehyde 2,1-aminomutase [Anaerovibrio slackiae]